MDAWLGPGAFSSRAAELSRAGRRQEQEDAPCREAVLAVALPNLGPSASPMPLLTRSTPALGRSRPPLYPLRRRARADCGCAIDL